MQSFSTTEGATHFVAGTGEQKYLDEDLIGHLSSFDRHDHFVLRPIHNEVRVQPSDLRYHRLSHQMLGPCCLCPLADSARPDFVEAAMYMASVGPYAGQYVASCAQDQCGYFSKQLP
jgi:hypothetical protein